ncbi:MAG: xanthine dehydrogenase small subunit [Proteobacteria bacterium]|jgi:xanthine dehydrogenase small subunit|nr:xanthine dehydrogenase small subunit [Pseudomonadota bacterium]MDA1238109.1 xanthine dehydrogenase small subunit [Pseudomonadota bacterium]
MITFLLNGEIVTVDAQPSDTLLMHLRETFHKIGTKEGCNEGDCGACSIIISDNMGVARVANSCILLMPQIHKKAIRTVEGISSPSRELHPIQASMIKHHGSQCGFCTPGFITTLAAAHKNGEEDFENQIAGNLCRCTGYGPIIKSAVEASGKPVPAWMNENLELIQNVPSLSNKPNSIQAFSEYYLKNPSSVIIAGGTDIALDINKKLKTIENPIFLDDCKELTEITVNEKYLKIGAASTISTLLMVMRDHHPHFAEMLCRYGSIQIRNSATIGGNIANGSPIGDCSPALIALNAILKLRQGSNVRNVPIEDFFIDYGIQDLKEGEFIEEILIPRQSDDLRCYKISKRFDQDISALNGCFNIKISEGKVSSCRIAFGGMSSTPKRAYQVESALHGEPWNLQNLQRASHKIGLDYSPLSDVRASSAYRLKVAQNMLTKVFYENSGIKTNIRNALV